MPKDSPFWSIELYPLGAEWGPVAEFIARLPPEQQARIARKFDLLEEIGPFDLGAGHVAPVHGAHNRVYELRVLGRRSYRLFFTCVGQVVVILHGAPKKSQRLHKRDIDLADRRAAEVRASLKETGK